MQMYKRVLSDPLEFPDLVPLNAKDLISRLLERNPHDRIKIPQIKEHPFFAPIDWKKLKNLEIRPPFVPEIQSSQDISNFEETFTREEPLLTPTQENLSPSVQKSFIGFSFDGRSMHQNISPRK